MSLDFTCIAGVDEAGRGPLAGPVVAAAVILNPAHLIAGLTDSKLLTEKQREHLFGEIMTYALAVSVAQVEAAEIDQLNIHHATLLAMQRAVEGLTLLPTHVQVDGKFCPKVTMSVEAIIQGDKKISAISAASVIAKVTRDRLMYDYHLRYPEYGFDRHKGYPTKDHVAALQQHGITPIHRRSYEPVRVCLGTGRRTAV